LAHPDSGLESFRGEKTKRLKAYHWTCSDAGISLSQVQNEVAETYTPAEDPHKKFTEDIQKFEEMFNDRLEYC
jgi:hypothetical protein